MHKWIRSADTCTSYASHVVPLPPFRFVLRNRGKLLFTNGKYAGLNYGVREGSTRRPGLSFCQLRVTFGASAFEDRIGCKFYVRCNFMGASIGCHRFRRVINHVLSCTGVGEWGRGWTVHGAPAEARGWAPFTSNPSTVPHVPNNVLWTRLDEELMSFKRTLNRRPRARAIKFGVNQNQVLPLPLQV